MDVVVGLGSNLGDRLETLLRAVRTVGGLARGVRASSLYETAPVGPPQPDYLNAAVRGEFDGAPRALMSALLEVERAAGRERRERHGPRTLDLDVLWIDGLHVVEADLVVPHPRLAERRFALCPLLDVAPEARDPATGVMIAEYLRRVPEGGIRRVSGPEWAVGAAGLRAH